jgi:chromosome segregation ATPase
MSGQRPAWKGRRSRAERPWASRQRAPTVSSIDQNEQSPELQRLMEAVGRATQAFEDVEHEFEAWSDGHDAHDRKAVWRRAAEFRRLVQEIRGHAATIHNEERQRTERRLASVQELLHAQAGHTAIASPALEEADTGPDRALDAALARAEERFQSARSAFADLHAAHQAGQSGSPEVWRQRVSDFREAMVEVHRLHGSAPRPAGP